MELPTKNTAACNMMYDVTPFFAVDSMGFSWILLHSVITAEVTPQITAARLRRSSPSGRPELGHGGHLE